MIALRDSGHQVAQALQHTLLRIIDFYQRHVSPYKRFRCAHAAVHGGASCSTYIRETISRHGIMRATGLARARFAACHAASREWKIMMAASREGAASGDKSGDKETPGERTRRCAVLTPATCCLTGFVLH